MPRKKIDVAGTADRLIGSAEMSAILGITPRWLTQLVTDGVIKKEGRGQYQISSTVQAYISFLKDGMKEKVGSTSMDRLREEKMKDIQISRLRKDRQLIDLEEALGFVDEVTGMFVSSLNGLPAQITGVLRERQRLNEIFDTERQRLATRLAKKRAALQSGDPDSDAEAEDDAA